VEVEWLILADAAQVVGNKLYLIGGGWDVLTVNTEFSVQRRCAVAAAVRVPWNETNQRHNLRIEIATEDANPIANIEGQFEVGRPPGIPLGQEQRIQIAADLNLKFDTEGGYVIIAYIDGQESRRIPFRVVAGPMLRGKQQRRENPG